MDKKTKELTRLLCKWNRREVMPEDFACMVWALYRKEALETWNDPLEKLIYEGGNK